jgi:cell division protein FtsL
MNRLAIIGGLVVAVLAVAVYRAKLGAEETQGKIEGLTGEAAAINKDISVMKAEEAYLTRPERIGPIAREKLGLEPASPGQYTAS